MTDTKHDAARVSGTIKALEWFSDRTAQAATTSFGQYRVANIHGRWAWFFEFIPVGGEDRIDRGYGAKNSCKSAKAAAQADYEARILAAIQPDPEQVSMEAVLAKIKRLEAALRRKAPPTEYQTIFRDGGIAALELLSGPLRALAGEGRE